MTSMIALDNIHDNEVVHQRSLLLTGHCKSAVGDESHIKVVAKDTCGRITFPEQRWPMSHGVFKALAMLTPGHNVLHITSGQNPAHSVEICIQYVPLLQTPPLHLAIMVAKDSPLMIDCPPRKFGALSSAHSSLDAAIAKLRVTAYMWQAFTAEEMRSNGLGRRSFRLEDEWSPDTTSRAFANETTMTSTAKIHLIRTEKTVAELRDAQLAQQNPNASRANELHEIFTEALLEHGAPFTKDARPVVAGMILDSHYDTKAKLIVAHAALGAHDSDGLSLGIFGSHLTYSWPRFMEEVPDCLLDTASPGDCVGNDNGECVSMWEACSVGQGAFLHEVGHAFSAPHTTGIMSRGYSQDWPKGFLSKTAYCQYNTTEAISPVTLDTPNDCHWDIRDLLRFRNLIHFRLPSDVDLADASPRYELQDDEDFLRVVVTSEAGMARVMLNGAVEASPSVRDPATSIQFTLDELETRFDRDKPLELEVVAMNGKHRTWGMWKLFSDTTYIRIPGTGIRLMKKSVTGDDNRSDDWSWVVMLKKRSRDGSMVSASKVDIRVGCGLDGAIVYYKDGTSIPCGPRGKHGQDPHMGGHQAKKLAIPRGVDIAKVAVSKHGSWDLSGLRLVLSNGKAMGALNKGHGGSVEVLVPEDGHRIVGFYGTSGQYGMCKEFGIVTAPIETKIPDSAYDLPELQNNPEGGSGRASKRRRQDSDTEDEETETSEDDDDGYDNDSDVDDI